LQAAHFSQQKCLILDAHENGPRCAHFCGPTTCADQRDLIGGGHPFVRPPAEPSLRPDPPYSGGRRVQSRSRLAVMLPLPCALRFQARARRQARAGRDHARPGLMRGGAGFEIASMRLRFLKYAQHARGATAAKVFRQFNALKSLYLFNRRVLWPSFDHNVRAQQQPRTLGRSPLLARAKDQTFTAFPLTRLENQPPAYLSVGHQLLLSTSSNA
jgi:hypothetical protein